MKVTSFTLMFLLASTATAEDLGPTIAAAARCSTLNAEKCAPFGALAGRGTAALPAAVKALGAKQRPTRLVGARLLALGQLGSAEQRRAALVAAIPQIGDLVRGEALQLLGELGGSTPPQTLTAAILNPNTDPRNRIFAANGLAAIKSPASRKALTAALNDPHPRVQEAAARNLGKLGDPAAVPPLIRRATAEMTAGYVRAAAATSLGRLKDTRALAALVLVLATETPGARMAAARALGALNDTSVVPLLLTRLSDKEALVGTIDALGKLADTRAIGGLSTVASTASTPERLRLRALWALGSVGDDSAVNVLTGILVEPQPKLVQGAVEALGLIASAKAATHLVPLLSSKDPSLIQSVTWALEKCTGQKHGANQKAWEAWLEGR